jgi:hypothetical protein
VAAVSGAQTVDVGPPQTQVWGACSVGSAPPSQPTERRSSKGEVVITFIGAANAQFTQSFPINGANVQISMLTLTGIKRSTLADYSASKPS